MKCFISYKFSGENTEELEKTLKHVCNLIDAKGHRTYCSFWDRDVFAKKKYSKKQILNYALNEIDKSDCIVIFIKSEDKSEGMLLEVGYALAKKRKIVLIIKKGVKTSYIRELADITIEFENLSQLKEIKI